MFKSVFDNDYVKDFINEVLQNNEGKTFDYNHFYSAFNCGFATEEEAIDFLIENVIKVVEEFENNGYREFSDLKEMFTNPLGFANNFLFYSSGTLLSNCPSLANMHDITLDETTINKILSELSEI